MDERWTNSCKGAAVPPLSDGKGGRLRAPEKQLFLEGNGLCAYAESVCYRFYESKAFGAAARNFFS